VSPENFKVIIAGGGTGGHLYPALALVQEIENRFQHCDVLFIGTARGIEAKVLPQLGYNLKLIAAKGFERKFSLKNLLLPFYVIFSFIQCAITIISFKPHVVIGTGGYVSAPALFIAALLRFPTLIQEQNSYPGISTRILSRFVDQVHVSFENSVNFFKNKQKVYVSGNPIRSNLKAANKKDAANKMGIDVQKKTLLIFGGSQGAHSINMAGLNIVDKLIEQTDWQIVWGSGERDYQQVNERCRNYGSRVFVKSYISDMASAYAVTDLVVSRAGASTLAELQVCGLPAILVPYPFATAGHQEANARALVAQQAAKMVLDKELNTELFLTTILDLMRNEQQRKNLGENLTALAKPNAAKHIIEKMVEYVESK